MYDYRKNNKRPRRRATPAQPSPGNVADDGLPILGYSDEGRAITGITDGSVHDPNAEILDEQGETSYHDLSKKKAIKMCAPDQHDLVPEGEPGEEIPGNQSMKCRRCPFGQLVPIATN